MPGARTKPLRLWLRGRGWHCAWIGLDLFFPTRYKYQQLVSEESVESPELFNPHLQNPYLLPTIRSFVP